LYKVSVVIPTVGENTLSIVLEALKNSTIKPIEIILSVHENNYKLVSKYQSNIVKILINNKIGQVSQRIYGFKNAKGDYILQLDSDIVIESNTIENLLLNINLLESNSALAPTLKSNKNLRISSKNKFKKLGRIILNLLLDGKFKTQPGTITKSSIETLPYFNLKQSGNFKVDWLPGGCILHKKENLILKNYFHFKGKALCEDLFHSYYLSKNNIQLFINNSIVVQHVDNSYIDFSSYFKVILYLKNLYNIRIAYLKLINGSKLRFNIWFIYFFIKNSLNYIKS